MNNPQRTCIACKSVKDKKDLIRIVKTKEGEIELDPTGRKNGRGAYLCHKEECLRKAAKNRGLERSFRMKVDEETLHSLLEQIRNE